jgi:hypothetical protein
VNEGMAAILWRPVWRQLEIAAGRPMSNEVFSQPPEIVAPGLSAGSDCALDFPARPVERRLRQVLKCYRNMAAGRAAQSVADGGAEKVVGGVVERRVGLGVSQVGVGDDRGKKRDRPRPCKGPKRRGIRPLSAGSRPGPS